MTEWDIWIVDHEMHNTVDREVEMVDHLLICLTEAIRTGDPRLVCYLSRELVTRTVLVIRPAALWTRERTAEACRLLECAAKATVGTLYENDCEDRLEDFQTALARVLERDEAWQDLLAHD